MVAPRVTKCGHLYCYPCLIQYLDFERENRNTNYGKCPLCTEPIQKRHIRRATINHQDGCKEKLDSDHVSLGKSIKFNLMIRNMSNINVKAFDNSTYYPCDSDSESVAGKRTILEARLPMIDQKEYKHSRIRVSDEAYWKAGL
jgi:hypothetical protein